MTYYAFHARDFLTQTRMTDGDDVRKACDNFSLHLKYPLTLRPEQRQAVEALLQGRDILAILPTGYGKSMIFQVYVAAAALKPGFHMVVSVVSVASVVRKKFIGQIEFILSRTASFICRFFCIEHL